MKIKASSLWLCFSLFHLSVFLNSCNSGPSESTDCDEVVVDELGESKSKIPYTGYDTLTFVRTPQGDTNTFIGKGLKTGFANVSYNEIDCTRPSKLEYVSYEYASSTFTEHIYMALFIKRYGETPLIQVDFNNQKFLEDVASLGPPYYIDSMAVNGKEYYNLERISDYNNPLTDKYYIIYSDVYGMLQIKFPNGDKWNLLK